MHIPGSPPMVITHALTELPTSGTRPEAHIEKLTPEQLDAFELVWIGLEEFFAGSNRKLIAVVEEQGRARLPPKRPSRND